MDSVTGPSAGGAPGVWTLLSLMRKSHRAVVQSRRVAVESALKCSTGFAAPQPVGHPRAGAGSRNVTSPPPCQQSMGRRRPFAQRPRSASELLRAHLASSGQSRANWQPSATAGRALSVKMRHSVVFRMAKTLRISRPHGTQGGQMTKKRQYWPLAFEYLANDGAENHGGRRKGTARRAALVMRSDTACHRGATIEMPETGCLVLVTLRLCESQRLGDLLRLKLPNNEQASATGDKGGPYSAWFWGNESVRVEKVDQIAGEAGLRGPRLLKRGHERDALG